MSKMLHIISLKNPNLDVDCISKEHMLLHVAVANELVTPLANYWMSKKILVMLDGCRLTACCYGAKSPKVITYLGENNVTPLKIAASLGNKMVFRHFLKHAQVIT